MLEGVDGAGKTTRARRIMNLDLPVKYFRSSYQSDSEFAGEKVDLEESAKHDWRVLGDFIRQTHDGSYHLLVDRGFLSSLVYSKVIRNVDLSRWVDEYLRQFRDSAQFWIFTRQDTHNMESWEVAVDQEYREIRESLRSRGFCVKRFERTEDSRFVTEDFLDPRKEEDLGHLDSKYYGREVRQWLDYCGRPAEVVVSDLDDTLVLPNGALKADVIAEVDSLRKPLLVVTGRDRVSDYETAGVRQALRGLPVKALSNSRNLGLSSRVLKDTIVSVLRREGVRYHFLDDRLDVMDYVFPFEDHAKTAGVYWRTPEEIA